MATDERVNILLVDDQPAKLLSCEAILQELGENILSADSARDALEQLLRHSVAVILIDVCMPELDGFELATMIRDHPRFKSTPIIFVSAIALTDLDRLKGYEHGAVDYVPVPLVPEILRAKVRIFVELYRKTRQLEQLNAGLERRVADRTAELEQANVELERRVEQRTLEREIALAKVHEMQKLESLGQLTGGLAHDFNNVLMAVLGQLDLAEREVGSNAKLKRLIALAIRAAERGSALTKRLLAFARRQELRPEAVDVSSLAGGMLEMLSRSLGPTIEIKMAFEEGLPAVLVDQNQLELALLNLSLNSRDAMPDGGRLTVSARAERVAMNQIFGLGTGKYVCIAVADTGMGMDDVTLKRAAEPFFTTKGIGKGTGLGLSTVHGLAAQSGGTIRIVSKEGAGTTVELWLPEAPPAEKSVDELSGASQSRSEPAHCVLLVEDDALVAEGTREMLEYLGHKVIVCASGPAAMQVIGSGTKFDLVITDHAMQGMTGRELALRIRQLGFEQPIVLATGYAERGEDGDMELPRLAKPFRINDLEKMIAMVMSNAIKGSVVPFRQHA
jgi:signal transduction histidine kinase